MFLPGLEGKALIMPALIRGKVIPNKMDWGKMRQEAVIHLYKLMERGEPRCCNTLVKDISNTDVKL